MTILVVEDERRLADALSEILTEVKYMVDTVYDGNDGLAYAESGIYDVIILDVMLPGKNGFEIVSALRKKKIATPVLMLTARGEVTDKIRGLDAGGGRLYDQTLLARRTARPRAGPFPSQRRGRA